MLRQLCGDGRNERTSLIGPQRRGGGLDGGELDLTRLTDAQLDQFERLAAIASGEMPPEPDNKDLSKLSDDELRVVQCTRSILDSKGDSRRRI